jgi:hypothetical protein
MHRIDTSTAQVDKFGAGKNGFTGGNPQTGELPTALDEDFFDSIQEEISGVIEGAGIVLDKTEKTQLLSAIKKITLIPSNKFSEIKALGAAAQLAAIQNLGLTPTGKQTFTASGSWTCPAGVTTAYLSGCSGGGGGGGGGGGVSSSTTRTSSGGGGGGGGRSSVKFPVSVTPGNAYSITIGAAGTGGAGGPLGSNGTNGGGGGTTSFGTLLALSGGSGGEAGIGAGGAAIRGGAGGSPGGGAGGDGLTSQGLPIAMGGNGGSSPYGTSGGGGRSGTPYGVSGTAGYGYGAGGAGGGGCYGGNTSTAIGGDGLAGMPGIMIVEW